MTERERQLIWLRNRQSLVTSTDLASIMRVPGAYSSPMGVYLEKTTPIDEGADDLVPEYVKWGQRLQGPILAGYTEKTGSIVVPEDPYVVWNGAKYPLLGASLDARWAAGDQRPVEAKNVGIMDKSEWGSDGTQDIPERFYVQVTAQMMVLGTQRAELAALFGGRKLGVYLIELDPELAAGLYEAAERFVRDYIVPDIPPPVDGSDEWTRFIASRRQTTQKLLTADAGVEVYASRLRRIRRILKRLEPQKDEAENIIKNAIGGNEGVQGAGWKATYRQAKDGQVIDWQAVAVLLSRQHGIGRAEFDEFVQQQTKTRPGSRRFLFNAKEDK